MAHILVKTEELGPKSFQTQLFIITDKKQDFILTFSGFLEKENGNLAATFDPHEVVMYSKQRAAKIKADLKKQDLRKVEITSSLKQKIADWVMNTMVKVNL